MVFFHQRSSATLLHLVLATGGRACAGLHPSVVSRHKRVFDNGKREAQTKKNRQTFSVTVVNPSTALESVLEGALSWVKPKQSTREKYTKCFCAFRTAVVFQRAPLQRLHCCARSGRLRREFANAPDHIVEVLFCASAAKLLRLKLSLLQFRFPT